MKRKLFLTIIALITIQKLYSQSANWKYIRPSNTGLGGDYYQCIEVDRCGNKWTGGYLPFWSQGAVSRFDDTVFTCWSNFDGYIPADRVYDVAFDNNDGLWVATNGIGNGIANGGIAHYDGTTWTQYTSLNSPLPEDDMRGIVVDHNNNVWATFLNVQTLAGGVAKFDGTTWTIYTPGNSNLQSGSVDKIDVDLQNNIWIGSNLGLIKFDGFNWILYNTQNSGLSNNDVTDVEYDETTNKIYAATGISIDIYDGTNWSHINNSNAPVSTTGLWAVDARGDSVIIATLGGTYLTYIYDGSTWISHQEPNHTNDTRIDAEGNFWTCGIGVVSKYDGVSWTEYNSKNSGLTGMFNDDIFVDSKNRAWFGSSDNGGINMFDCPRWQDYNPYNAGVWPQPITYTGSGTGTTEDSYGDIWMLFSGVAGGAVQIPNGDVNNPAAWTVWENVNSGISLQFLSRAAADQSGNVWVGYDDACSVSKFSHATNSWTNYNLFQLGQITCGAGSGIESIRVDDSNNVWVCGLAGLAKFDQTKWTFYSYLNTPMLQGFVMDIAFDTLGNKWIATESGLYKFDGINWTNYNSSNTPMFGDWVKTVLVDNAGTIWVGVTNQTFPYPSGLFSFDGTTWTTYTPSNSGLPEKYVERLALDTLGNIWVVTASNGCAIFNPNGVIGYSCLDKSLQNCTTTSISENNVNAGNALTAIPNPFSTTTTLEFNLSETKNVSISITDVMGRIVKTIPTNYLQSEKNKITIDLSELKSGIYFCKIYLNENRQTIKLIKN
ncbi:MAG: T9SS type A sorting domain-containing protein [Bacteroidia bacterium]